jgi:putative acetyltransferase
MPMIRDEEDGDEAAIRAVLDAAFESPVESGLVDALRAACPQRLSLAALTDDEEVVGCILFTPVVIDGVHGAIEGYGLAPMAVHPSAQRAGIGSALVRAGLDRLDRLGCPFVVVVGHAEYYPRFGFERASTYGVRCQWDGVPDEAFMIRVHDASLTSRLPGVARYRPEFDAVA